ncbi:hypothetical protein [Nostoc sp. UHCC 0252]|uniref:hypothetical protein n=1 Tax=Nostoc sp. UHCC 0252 TaxID=3110241 RepID=UPI003A4C5B8C
MSRLAACKRDLTGKVRDAINRRQDEKTTIVETAIHRVSCVNRTVLPEILKECAKGIGSQFFSVDVIESKDGTKRIVEIADG